MRIISGEARGRRLFAPDGTETRPTADRVREAVFNIIRSEVCGARVLDLFAGSGALALEALSRGAAHAVLCDCSKKAAAVIRRNIELMRAQDRTTLITGDWKTALSAGAGAYTLVFLDPPYRMTDVYAQAANSLLSGGLLAPDALIVMEHAAELSIASLTPPLYVADRRTYRDTAISFVRIKQEDEA